MKHQLGEKLLSVALIFGVSAADVVEMLTVCVEVYSHMVNYLCYIISDSNVYFPAPILVVVFAISIDCILE